MGKPIPPTDVAMVDGAGRITPVWYEYFRALGIADLADVKFTGLANGQSPVWDASLKKFVNQPN
jgi:hypothetical protein